MFPVSTRPPARPALGAVGEDHRAVVANCPDLMRGRLCRASARRMRGEDQVGVCPQTPSQVAGALKVGMRDASYGAAPSQAFRNSDSVTIATSQAERRVARPGCFLRSRLNRQCSKAASSSDGVSEWRPCSHRSRLNDGVGFHHLRTSPQKTRLPVPSSATGDVAC
jgi:hypothetical protein